MVSNADSDTAIERAVNWARAVRRQWGTRKGLQGKLDAAPRQELEQAALRVVVSVAICFYVMSYLATRDAHPNVEGEARVVAGVFFVFAFAVVLRILQSPGESVARRVLGILADNAIATYCLLRTREGGTVILSVYLFVTLGNGFRYGRPYLHISQFAAILGISLVMLVSDFWSEHVLMGIGLIVTMVVVPLYTGVLAERIKEARIRADVANQAKGRFLANVSHEMRTPLNGVVAMADVLRETALSESQREIVDTLGNSANLLLAQIEDVLDMAKIEAGRVQIEVKPFELGKLLTGTVKIVLPQARYKALTVTTEIEPDIAGWFSGDSHHIGQVLLNLLANAVKFTERGNITLHVTKLEESPIGTRIRFEVIDTGIGIPEEKQATIFEPFTQADESITRVYGGTGLGTSIARQLVILMGGQIGLKSSVGIGSVFWFELPLHRSEPTAIDLVAEIVSDTRASSKQQATITRIRGARILVAEDNATNQRVTELILESGGHHSTIVDNGEAALDALERGGFDLALFDLSMPLVSGIEALKLYQYTTRKPIPVLILSANVTNDIVAECVRAGCTEFLAKPIRPATLLDAIERHLDVNVSVRPQSPRPSRSEEVPLLTIIDTPIVDQRVLADLAQISPDPTFVERLVRGFRSDAERLAVLISDCLASRKYEEVKDAAHALKGGAGSVGATQLVQLAIRFEKASYDTLRIKSAAWTEELTRATTAALNELDVFIKNQNSRSNS